MNPERSIEQILIDNQVERIQELKELNAELLDASSALITAIDQQSFFFDGYRNGSASISECNHASDELDKAKSKLFDIIKKAKGL